MLGGKPPLTGDPVIEGGNRAGKGRGQPLFRVPCGLDQAVHRIPEPRRHVGLNPQGFHGLGQGG